MMEDLSGVSDQLPLQLCVVGSQLAKDNGFLTQCEGFKVPIKLSSDGDEYLGDTNVRTVFVLPIFSGSTFERLVSLKRPILGPPAIQDLRTREEGLLVKRSPVFCLTLYGCGIVLSGYRRKADLERLIKLVHWCGGSVIKDAGTKMTQLVAANSMGEKYQYAATFSIPVLTEQWLSSAWERREEIGYRANAKESMGLHKLKLFAGNVVHFYGFEQSELTHMQEVLASNGGRVAGGLCDTETTHVVVDDNTIEVLPAELETDVREGCHIVKGEWFWRSIQIEAAANPSHYRWRKDPQNIMSPNYSYNMSLFSPTNTPLGNGVSGKRRKRRRQQEMLHILAQESPAHKRRSSVTDLNALNMSGSLLDATDPRTLDGDVCVMETPENSPARECVASSTPAFDANTATARQQVFHEFVTTETNYVDILECITKIAKEAEDPTQQGGALLDQQEMKIIFGMIEPIQKVHSEMLTKLVNAEDHWSEPVTVGSILLHFAEDLLKAYPPFVNFFERTKCQIKECDQKSVRFHAFLKMCERRPECSRQTLPELMIRPVQRLPSISLLLNDLLKHTKKADPGHPDCEELEKALAKIKEVMTHLNEEKRRTEGQIHIFDIYSEIENCPASIISSHRSFVTRVDCIEMAADTQLCGKGYELTLFLFTDILVVTKRKSSKSLSTSRSPSTASLAGAGVGHSNSILQSKALKFVKMIQLSSVRRLVDVLDTDDCDENGATQSCLVAIICRLTEDLRERMYVMQLAVDCNDDKLQFLRLLCRNVANTRCRPDPDELLAKMAACELGLDASDLNVTSFSKAISSFHKTKQKVGRAFSFNKTPNKLKRAVSTMISPMTAPRVLGESSTMTRLGTPSDGFSELRLEGGHHSTPDLEAAMGTSSKVSPYNMTAKDTVSSFCKVSPINPPVNVLKGWAKKKEVSNVLSCNALSPRGRSVSVTEISDNQDTPLTSRKTRQSCTNLRDEVGFSPMRKSFVRKFNVKADLDQVTESPGTENEDPDFRTPNLCSRPSFRDKFRGRPRAGTLGGFSRKH